MIDENYKKLQKYIQDIDSFALSTATTPDDQLLFCAAMVSVVRNLYLENLGVEQTNLIFEQLAQSFQIMDEFCYDKPTIH